MNTPKVVLMANRLTVVAQGKRATQPHKNNQNQHWRKGNDWSELTIALVVNRQSVGLAIQDLRVLSAILATPVWLRQQPIRCNFDIETSQTNEPHTTAAGWSPKISVMSLLQNRASTFDLNRVV